MRIQQLDVGQSPFVLIAIQLKLMFFDGFMQVITAIITEALT